MILSQRKLYIAVFIVAILGLFIVQFQYLKIGLNLAKVQFNKKIAVAGENIKLDLASENQLSFLIGQAAIKSDSYFKLSVDSIQDASRYFLNDFITYRLSKNGIETDFTYRLYTRDSAFYLKSPVNFKSKEKTNSYPIELEGYLPKLLEKNIILELQFKDLNSHFLNQLNGLTIPSLLFIIIIIIIFIWVLKSFYWQRRVITTTNQFINNLTHELKTPLFSISLASKILEEQGEPSNKPIIDIIKKQLNRLNQHVDKVLELGKLEFQKKTFILKKIDFKPQLVSVCSDFLDLAKLDNFEFSYELQGDKYFINAEVTHLENAINNILDNARKYVSDQPKIELKAFVEHKNLMIQVSDNGIGINSEEKQLVFKKYYRISNGNLHKTKGYGLGLSYVKEVVKNHKGKVKIESELNKGTTVKITIPLLKTYGNS
ncbi:ATP-binding protein [Yeosuana sp. MJ-SS3]|uniref:histidine kinase n=1 Tax=Gilvirhabdus luticola TaxID=3079858 RepID=A0ABU3U3T3_9FLAO|nr:ATP-binding protein [Yeosuana sp. MJ-SS3]MDU8885061.1 ATP-binding protein [Yeosuana sp. MJ-SS3]